MGIPVRAIGMRPGVPDPRGVVRLARLLHRERPGLIQTWMYHSNLIGGIAAGLSVLAPVVWGDPFHSSTTPGLRSVPPCGRWLSAPGCHVGCPPGSSAAPSRPDGCTSSGATRPRS